jgi:U3 small nucleolar RNA-associated protein 21
MTGFRGRILDVAFSPDSRWLITASLDSIIRTFDIPSGCLVDAFKTSSIPTSITFSPTGDFLASSHVDSVGVYLWANKAQFSEVALRAIEEDEVFETGLPSVQGAEEDEGPFLSFPLTPLSRSIWDSNSCALFSLSNLP